MAQIDTSFAQTAAQRLAKAEKKRKIRELATARVNAARKAAAKTFQSTASTTSRVPPTARSTAPGLRERFKNVIRSTQSARNRTIDKAVSDSVDAVEKGRRRVLKLKQRVK